MLLEECSLSRCAERPKCGPTALRPARAASRIVVTIAETSSRREMQDKWPCPLERRVSVPGRCVLLAGHTPPRVVTGSRGVSSDRPALSAAARLAPVLVK